MQKTAPVVTHFGVIAQFSEAEEILKAAKDARDSGFTKLEAYTPYHVEGLVDILGTRDDRVPWIVFICGISGAILGFLLQVYVAVIDYPMNVGGRPDLSWPSFIPVTFECGILAAALGGLLGMLFLNGLPRPHHPLFDVDGFEQVSKDKFYLCVESNDPNFDVSRVKDFFQKVGAEDVKEVFE
jgi:hypothetical protein